MGTANQGGGREGVSGSASRGLNATMPRDCENRNYLANSPYDKEADVSAPAERVRELIERSGLTQGEFASQVGLDAAKMSKSLGGARRFSSLDLARIAERFEVTVDWLLGADEPRIAMAARAAVGSSASLALYQAAELLEMREGAARLGYPQPWSPVPVTSTSTLAVDQGEALAHEALARVSSLGLSPVTSDLAGTIESAFGADVALASLGEGFDGLAASSHGGRLILAAVTPVAYRQRFTLAHELGHLLLDDDQGVHTDTDIFVRHPSSATTEMRANAFAASFLMPENLLRSEVVSGFDEVAFARLSIALLVSPPALAYRLASLRLIDDFTRDRWRGMTAKDAAGRAGMSADLAAATANSTNPRRPGLLARDLFAAYLDGKATLRPYAQLLGVETGQIRADLERSAEAGG